MGDEVASVAPSTDGSAESVGAQLTSEAARAVAVDRASTKTSPDQSPESEPVQKAEATESQSGEKAEAPKQYSFKLKVGGKERLIEGDEEYVKNVLQKGVGANDRYDAAIKLEQSANQKLAAAERANAEREQVFKQMLADPIAFARNNGADPRVVRDQAEKWLYLQLQEDEMSPELKAAANTQRENEKLKADLQAQTEAATQKEHNAQADKFRIEYENSIIEAAEGIGLPKNPTYIRQIADTVRLMVQRNHKVDFNLAAKQVKENLASGIRHTLGSYADGINEAHKLKDSKAVLALGEQLTDIVGDEFVRAVQRYGILKLRAGKPNMPQSDVVDTAKASQVKEELSPQDLSTDEAEEQQKERVAMLQRRFENQGAGAVS